MGVGIGGKGPCYPLETRYDNSNQLYVLPNVEMKLK